MIIRKTFIYFTLLTILLAGIECKSTQRATSQKAMYKAIYIDQFRLTYFRKILIKSYNNSKAIQEIISNDHSGFTEPVLTKDDYTLIDSLAFWTDLKANGLTAWQMNDTELRELKNFIPTKNTCLHCICIMRAAHP
jgi:hypothetical protein